MRARNFNYDWPYACGVWLKYVLTSGLVQEFDLINGMKPGSRNLKGRNPKKNPKVLVKRASDSPAPPLQHENNSCGLQPQGEERGGNTFPAGSVILGRDGCAPVQT